MTSADEFSPEQLPGKAVVFKSDDDHADCWHQRAGLKSGVVVRVVPSLAQKAELLASEGLAPPDALAAEEDVPRLWVRADPAPSFPRGCELAVEPDCLLVPGDPQG